MKISKEQGTNSFVGLTSTCSCSIPCYCVSYGPSTVTPHEDYTRQNYTSAYQNVNPY